MKEVDVRGFAATAVRHLSAPTPKTVTVEQLAQRLHDVLYGKKELFAALEMGLVTLDEVANAVTAYVHSWLVDQTTLVWSEDVRVDPAFTSELRKVLEEALRA